VTDFVRRQRDDFVNFVGSCYVHPAPYSLEIAGNEYRSGTTQSETQSLVFTINDDTGACAYRNFAITDDAVVFFFGEDQLIPQNDGPLKVTAARSQLQSVLA
jgi:hypothetical protein